MFAKILVVAFMIIAMIATAIEGPEWGTFFLVLAAINFLTIIYGDKQ